MLPANSSSSESLALPHISPSADSTPITSDTLPVTVYADPNDRTFSDPDGTTRSVLSESNTESTSDGSTDTGDSSSSSDSLSSVDAPSDASSEDGPSPSSDSQIGISSGRVFCSKYGNAYPAYCRSVNEDSTSNYAFHTEIGCECVLLSNILSSEAPMDRGVAAEFLLAHYWMENSELAMICSMRKECMEVDYTPLKTIISKFHELGKDIVLVLMGEGPPQFELAKLATSRVAVLAAMTIYEEESESDESEEGSEKSINNFYRMRKDLLKALGKSTNPREAVTSLHGRKLQTAFYSVTLKVDVHTDWMARRDESIPRVESPQEDPPPIIPSELEFRQLLKSLQSLNSKKRGEAEAEWRRIPKEDKKNLLLTICKSKNQKERSRAFSRLHSLFGCLYPHWGVTELAQFKGEMIAAAHVEKYEGIGEMIGEMLAQVVVCDRYRGQTACDIFQFILGSVGCENPAVKHIALYMAAEVPMLGQLVTRGLAVERDDFEINEFKEFFEKMIADETVRTKAIEQWTRCLVKCHNDFNHEAYCGIVYPVECTLRDIIKLCEGNLSTEKGAPLWAVMQVLPFADLDVDEENVPDMIVKLFVEAARESDDEALPTIVNAIRHVKDGGPEDIHWERAAMRSTWTSTTWIQVAILVHRCCKSNNKMLKWKALDIFARRKDSIDFGDDADSCVRMLMESIERCFWQLPQETRQQAFVDVASNFDRRGESMECIDRVFLLFTQAAMKNKDELDFLDRLSRSSPNLMHTHFDAVMDAFRVHADTSDKISYAYKLNDIMRHVPGELEDTKILQKYVDDSNKDIREAAMLNCQRLINGNQKRDDFLAQLSFYVPHLMQKTREIPTEESLRSLFGAVKSLPQVMLAPHSEEISRIVSDNMKSLNENSMGEALATFPPLLSSVGTKGGVEAMRSLWVVQWNALKQAIGEKAQKELTCVFMKTVTGCLSVLGREGVTPEEMKDIGWMITDQLEEGVRRMEKRKSEKTRKNPRDEQNGSYLVDLLSFILSLPLEVLASQAEEITKIVGEQLHSLDWEAMGKALATFPPLLSSVNTKGGVEAMRSLWVVQWNALKANIHKEHDSIVMKTVSECHLVLGREGVTADEMKEIAGTINLDELFTRAVQWKCQADDAFERSREIDRRRSEQKSAVDIATNLIKFDPEFALRHQKSITRILHDTLSGGMILEGHAVAAFASITESNHPQWAEVAVAALKRLCPLVARQKNWFCPIGKHGNPIWAVMRIVQNCGPAIGSEHFQLIVSSFLRWLPYLDDEKEGHHVYAFLAGLIEAHNDTLFGEPNEIGTKLLTALIKVIKGDLFFSSEEAQVVKSRLVAIVEKIDQSCHCSKVLTDWKHEEKEEKDSESSSTNEE